MFSIMWAQGMYATIPLSLQPCLQLCLLQKQHSELAFELGQFPYGILLCTISQVAASGMLCTVRKCNTTKHIWNVLMYYCIHQSHIKVVQCHCWANNTKGVAPQIMAKSHNYTLLGLEYTYNTLQCRMITHAYCMQHSCQNIITFSARSLPKAVRLSDLMLIRSRALSAIPMDLMQWWILPGPSRPWAISNPLPSPPIMLLAGTRTLSNWISKWPCGLSAIWVNPMLTNC